MESTDILVFLLVVGARFLLPLLIFRYPLPAILVCLMLDNVDQTIFQAFTNLDLAGYQGYDKALDIYYLTIAYISTFRNWENLAAMGISRFLYYYRLVGVVLFELAHWRPLLLLFPNTFEFFFIAIEGYAARLNPTRLTKKTLIKIAAFIWILIKLPQEFWLHIAQLDSTDLIKEKLLGVSLDTPWPEAVKQNLWIIPAVLLIVTVLTLAFRHFWKKLPPGDWRLRFDANNIVKLPKQVTYVASKSYFASIWNGAVLEKFVMISFVGIVFAQILPGVQTTNLQLAIGAGILIVANAAFSHWFAKKGRHWSSTLKEFIGLGLLNTILALVYASTLPLDDGSLNIGNTLFFVLMLTLLVTLYDRYRPIYDQRISSSKESA